MGWITRPRGRKITTEKPGVQVTAVDPGTVTSVHVEMHQKVDAGEILITYNDDETDKRLESQLRQKRELETQQKENQIILSLRRKQAEQRLSLDRDLLQRLENLVTVGAIEETQFSKRGRKSMGSRFHLKASKASKTEPRHNPTKNLLRSNKLFENLKPRKRDLR